MKTLKRKITVELPEAVWKTLDKWGYDYIKNFQEEAKNVAYLIWCEEANKDEDDIGTATVKEMRSQNNG